GKMAGVSGQGRTVVFVSHNMSAIRSLCNRAILLDGGRIVADGEVDPVTATYLSEAFKATATGEIPAEVERMGTAEAHFTGVFLEDRLGTAVSTTFVGQPFT